MGQWFVGLHVFLGLMADPGRFIRFGRIPALASHHFVTLPSKMLSEQNRPTRDRENRDQHPMKSSELANGENCIALRQLLQNRKLRHL